MDVSDPTSPKYRQYLSKEQASSYTAPSQNSLEAVTSWLEKYDVTYDFLSPSQELLRLNLTVAAANQLLNANYSQFVHEETSGTFFRTSTYTVPPDMMQHLSFIYPTTHPFVPHIRKPLFHTVNSLAFTPSVQSNASDVPCTQQINPGCIQELYGVPLTPANASGNGLAVSGFLNEVANQDDLTTFLQVLRPDFPQATFNVASVDGGANDGEGTPEATLDIQYTVGLATNVPTSFISVGSQNPDGVSGFLDIITSLLSQDAPPLVLTTSFGFDESVFDQFPEIANRICDAYAQLGLRGVSILFASGDGGVAGSQPNDTCPSGFVATFPSTCPYVTSVGSTQSQSPEVAASFSSGGFSNIFPQPSYQTAAVQTYLATLATPALDGTSLLGLFNASGRAFPDVAAQGSNFLIARAGAGALVSGTSASSPTFASVVALLNDRLLSAGRAPLGFLNPLLYSRALPSGALNDITAGSNPGCGTDGFPAAVGWDPVTGLGTPDFDKLLQVALG